MLDDSYQWLSYVREKKPYPDCLSQTFGDLSGTDLSGADLSGAEVGGLDFAGAKYTSDTKWPENFDPQAAGAVFVDAIVDPQ